MTKLTKPIKLHQPAEYLIELQGRLDYKWSASFDGLSMTTKKILGELTVTSLQGMVADQSALLGILNHISDLGLPLLKVECLPPPKLNEKE